MPQDPFSKNFDIDRRLTASERDAIEQKKLDAAEAEHKRKVEQRREQIRQQKEAAEKELRAEQEAKQERYNQPIREAKEKEAVFDNEESLNELHQRAERVIGNSEVDYNDFAAQKIYTPEDIQNDLNELADAKKDFSERSTPAHEKAKKIATILEGAMALGIAQLKWFGDLIEIYTSTEFDDIKNKVDGILRFNQNESPEHLALGIDVTFQNQQNPEFEEKFFRLLRKIDKGEMAKVKYFQTYDGDCVPEFSMPEIILSFDINTTKDLAYNFKNIKDAAHKENLKNHKVRYEIVGQIIGECTLFANYARNHGQPQVADSYDAVMKLVTQILELDPKQEILLSGVGADRVSESLQNIIARHEKKAEITADFAAKNMKEAA